MASGDITAYAKWLLAQEDGDAGATLSSTPVDFNADTIKLIILTDSHTPDTTGSSTQEHLDDISANEVATGSSYTGAITLASVTVTESGGTVTFDAADINLANDVATGFTNGRWAVIYKDSGTAATSPLIFSLDLGSNRSLADGALDFVWDAAGIMTKVQV